MMDIVDTSNPALIDLIDTNFHHNGFIPPSEPFAEGFAAYMSRRSYRPDPLGDPTARAAIAGYYEGQGFTVDPDDIVLCASTSEAYTLLFATFGRPGEQALIPRPGYPLVENLAAYCRLRPSFVGRSPADDFEVREDALRLSTTTDTRFIVAVSPDNPTGRVIRDRELDTLLAHARRSAAYLIWDEVFADLTFEAVEDAAHPLAQPLARNGGPVCFILNGASKLLASPDLKIGWIVIAGDRRRRRSVRERLVVANDHLLSASSFGQAILPRLFDGLDEFRGLLRETVATRRELFLGWLREEERVTAVTPAGGIHALCYLTRSYLERHHHVDDEYLAAALLSASPSVRVHPGFLYGVPEPEVAFVVALLSEESKLQRGLETVSRILGALA